MPKSLGWVIADVLDAFLSTIHYAKHKRLEQGMDGICFSATDFVTNVPSKIDMLSPGGGINLWVLGLLVTLKVLGNGTRGAYSVMEFVVPPGHGPPVHLHLNEEESWFILDGELIGTVKGEEFHTKRGSFIHLPRLVAHTFTNKFDKPAHVLVSFYPAGLEKWYLDVGRPVTDPYQYPPPATDDDMAKAIFKAMNYGIVYADRIVEPPLQFFI